MIRSFDSLMLRTLLAPLLAALQLFAVYVLLHGHYSPGGGFVAGVLFAASMILPRLTLGHPTGRLALTPQRAAIMAVSGILLFSAVGIVPMLLGQPMLDYAALPLASTAPYRRSMAILLIEIGVTLAVAGSMLSIFYALSEPVGGEDPT
ncbi:Na(+)/H(+) antiporter subunit B [soil metagenome]